MISNWTHFFHDPPSCSSFRSFFATLSIDRYIRCNLLEFTVVEIRCVSKRTRKQLESLRERVIFCEISRPRPRAER